MGRLSGRRAWSGLLTVCLCLLAAPGSVVAHDSAFSEPPAPHASARALTTPCPGDTIVPDRVITGELGKEHQGSYVLVPFDVPTGTTAVRVKYCYDQPEVPVPSGPRHTLDLGLYDARQEPGSLFGEREFRGWGGSSHPDVTVSPEGFSSEQQYRTAPEGHLPGKTTRGFGPGPLPAGQWAAELGVAAVVGQTEGDLDGKVAWRIEVELSSDPGFADEPYVPEPYNSAPARGTAGWYAGDLHVHAEHSALGDATMTEVFDYGFRSPEQGGAGLDFITLSDYVTDSAWGEIGRHQPRHPGKLITRSAEVITYRGHANNHASGRYVDYRTGPVLERASDGTLELRREPRPAREIFDAVRGAGGFTQVNHPTIFPSESPGFANLCRGCPWDYSDDETRWEQVDAYEVHTGPPGSEQGPNPFTLTAIDEYDRLRRAGHRIAAVAVSDSHHAGRTPNPVTQSPIGVGTTVVKADELSEKGIQRGVEAGHTYVKLFGADSPDLRLEAERDGNRAIMGDALPGDTARFVARVTGGVQTGLPRQLVVLRDGRPIQAVPVTGPDFSHTFTGTQAGDYRLQVMRGSLVDGLTTPITLGAPGSGPGAGAGAAGAAAKPKLRLRVKPRRARVGRRRFVFRVTTQAGRPVRRALVRFAGMRGRTSRTGRIRMAKRFTRVRRYRAVATRPGARRAVATIRVVRGRSR